MLLSVLSRNLLRRVDCSVPLAHFLQSPECSPPPFRYSSTATSAAQFDVNGPDRATINSSNSSLFFLRTLELVPPTLPFPDRVQHPTPVRRRVIPVAEDRDTAEWSSARVALDQTVALFQMPHIPAAQLLYGDPGDCVQTCSCNSASTCSMTRRNLPCTTSTRAVPSPAIPVQSPLPILKTRRRPRGCRKEISPILTPFSLLA